MKTMKTIMMGLALVILSGATMATGNLKLNVVSVDKEKAVVTITNAAESLYELELRNEKGEVMYYKRTTAPSSFYTQAYNLAELENGNYHLTASIKNEKEVRVLKIEDGDVNVVNEEKIVEPFFTVQNKTFALSHLNYAMGNVKFYLYDNNSDNLLFEKKLKPEFAINYGLDLSNLKSGKYNAVLVDKNGFYKYKIILD